MPDNFLDRMELDKRIEGMENRQLMEFTAKEVYSISVQVTDHQKRIKKLENRNRKEMGLVGTIGGILGVAFASILDYFLRGR